MLPQLKGPLMTVVVAGGGFAGVETIAGVNDFLREAIPFYGNLREEDLRVVLVHSGPVILPELSEKLGRRDLCPCGSRSSGEAFCGSWA